MNQTHDDSMYRASMASRGQNPFLQRRAAVLPAPAPKGGAACLPVEKLPPPRGRTGVGTGPADPAAAEPII